MKPKNAIVETARAQNATLVVLDGFRSMRGFLADDPAAAHFLYSLRAKRALLVATSLVIVDGEPDDTAGYPGLTVCDVIVALSAAHRQSTRAVARGAQSGGSAPLEGTHPCSINRSGLTVFPRFESVSTRLSRLVNPGGLASGSRTFMHSSAAVLT
jgi:hypothetical protein